MPINPALLGATAASKPAARGTLASIFAEDDLDLGLEQEPGFLLRVAQGLDAPRRWLTELIAEDVMGLRLDEDKSGASILQQLFGMKQREGKADPADFLGFGLEVATDPLTYLGGIGTLNRAGRAKKGLQSALRSAQARQGAIDTYRTVVKSARAQAAQAAGIDHGPRYLKELRKRLGKKDDVHKGTAGKLRKHVEAQQEDLRVAKREFEKLQALGKAGDLDPKNLTPSRLEFLREAEKAEARGTKIPRREVGDVTEEAKGSFEAFARRSADVLDPRLGPEKLTTEALGDVGVKDIDAIFPKTYRDQSEEDLRSLFKVAMPFANPEKQIDIVRGLPVLAALGRAGAFAKGSRLGKIFSETLIPGSRLSGKLNQAEAARSSVMEEHVGHYVELQETYLKTEEEILRVLREERPDDAKAEILHARMSALREARGVPGRAEKLQRGVAEAARDLAEHDEEINKLMEKRLRLEGEMTEALESVPSKIEALSEAGVRSENLGIRVLQGTEGMTVPATRAMENLRGEVARLQKEVDTLGEDVLRFPRDVEITTDDHFPGVTHGIETVEEVVDEAMGRPVPGETSLGKLRPRAGMGRPVSGQEGEVRKGWAEVQADIQQTKEGMTGVGPRGPHESEGDYLARTLQTKQIEGTEFWKLAAKKARLEARLRIIESPTIAALGGKLERAAAALRKKIRDDPQVKALRKEVEKLGERAVRGVGRPKGKGRWIEAMPFYRAAERLTDLERTVGPELTKIETLLEEMQPLLKDKRLSQVEVRGIHGRQQRLAKRIAKVEAHAAAVAKNRERRAAIAGRHAGRRVAAIAKKGRAEQAEIGREGARAERIVGQMTPEEIEVADSMGLSLEVSKGAEVIAGVTVRASLDTASLQNDLLGYLEHIFTPEGRKLIAENAEVQAKLKKFTSKFVQPETYVARDMARLPEFRDKYLLEVNKILMDHLGTNVKIFDDNFTRTLPQKILGDERNLANAMFTRQFVEQFAEPIQEGMDSVLTVLQKGGVHRFRYKGFDYDLGALRETRAYTDAQEVLGKLGIPTELVDEWYHRIEQFSSPEAWSDMGKAYDWLKGKTEKYLTTPFIPFHFRNATTNGIINWLAGAASPAALVRAFDIWWEKGPEYERLRTIGVPKGSYVRELLHAGDVAKPADTFLGEVAQRAKTLTEEGAAAPVRKKLRRGAEFVEDVGRIWHYLARKEQGLTDYEAVQSVNKYLFDYSALTHTEKKIGRRIFMFYNWTRKIAPLLATQYLENPSRMAALTRLTAQPTVARPKFTTEYIRATSALPWAFGEEDPNLKKYITGIGSPLEELHKYDVTQRQPGVSGLIGETLRKVFAHTAPPIRLGAELAAGEDFFFRKPLAEADYVRRLPFDLQKLLSDYREETLPSGRVRRRANPDLQLFLRNIPGARFLGEAGKLSDDRKTDLEKAINFLTGMQIRDVDLEYELPRARKREVERRLQPFVSSGDVRTFSRMFSTEFGKENPEVAGLLERLRILDNRRREARREEQAAR